MYWYSSVAAGMARTERHGSGPGGWKAAAAVTPVYITKTMTGLGWHATQEEGSQRHHTKTNHLPAGLAGVGGQAGGLPPRRAR